MKKEKATVLFFGDKSWSLKILPALHLSRPGDFEINFTDCSLQSDLCYDDFVILNLSFAHLDERNDERYINETAQRFLSKDAERPSVIIMTDVDSARPDYYLLPDIKNYGFKLCGLNDVDRLARLIEGVDVQPVALPVAPLAVHEEHKRHGLLAWLQLK